MASHQKTRKEHLSQQKKILKNQMREKMDQHFWSKLEYAWSRFDEWGEFQEEHAAIAPNFLGIMGFFFGIGMALGLGEVKQKPFLEEPIWYMVTGLLLFFHSHNDQGRKIITGKMKSFYTNSLKPRAEVAGSVLHTLASSAGRMLPEPSFRVIGWFERIIKLAVIGFGAYYSYLIYPFILGLVESIGVPSQSVGAAQTYSVILSSMPITISLMMLRNFGWRWRRLKLGAAMLLGSVQFLAAFHLLFTGQLI